MSECLQKDLHQTLTAGPPFTLTRIIYGLWLSRRRVVTERT